MAKTPNAHADTKTRANTPPPAFKRPKAQPAEPAEAMSDDLVVARRKSRLNALVQKEGRSGTSAIARKANRGQSYISHLRLKGYPFGDGAARELEMRLGLPHMYFDMADSEIGAPDTVRLVPVEDWASVGRHQPRAGGPVVRCAQALGPRAVAVVARGMMWSGEGLPGIPSGWHAIIDPDRSVKEGDLVVCWLPNASEATMRHHLLDSGTSWLYPIDQRQPGPVEWTKSILMVGPVVAAQKSFR